MIYELNVIIEFIFFLSDNPDVDVKGANLFKEHLQINENKSSRRSSARSSRRSSYVGDSSKWNQKVESILVCTGVYNPDNDLLVYLRSLFNSTTINDLDTTPTEKHAMEKEDSTASLDSK